MTLFTKLAIVLALGLALLAGLKYVDNLGYQRRAAEDQVIADQLKLKAQATLLAETERANKATADFKAFVSKQEIQDANDAATISAQAVALRKLRNDRGQLWDPNATRGCGVSGGGPKGGDAQASADSGGDGAQTGGLLSAELSGLLQARLEEADKINRAYIACRPFALKAATSPP